MMIGIFHSQLKVDSPDFRSYCESSREYSPTDVLCVDTINKFISSSDKCAHVGTVCNSSFHLCERLTSVNDA